MNPVLALMVALGGAVGALLRYGTNIALGSLWGTAFPYGTLFINISGCFVMGVIAGVGAFVWQWPEPIRVLVMVGILGGYTTFSAFSLDVLTLVDRGAPAAAIGYVLASVLGSLISVFSGLALVKALS